MSIDTLIENELEPYLIDIDYGNYYAKSFIQQLFTEGHFSENNLIKNAQSIEKVSEACLTTGFCLWCQLAFSTYLKQAKQPALYRDLQ